MNTANLRLRDRWLLALFASLFLAVGASAQNEVEIQGRVTADGQPLVGASVIIKERQPEPVPTLRVISRSAPRTEPCSPSDSSATKPARSPLRQE